jgi:hypothetical protein
MDRIKGGLDRSRPAGRSRTTDGQNPRAPYCLFAAISNATNDGWAGSVATPQCYPDALAPSDQEATRG